MLLLVATAIHAFAPMDDIAPPSPPETPAAFRRATKHSIAIAEGLIEVQIVCERKADESLELYLEIDADAWEGLASFKAGFDETIMVPAGCEPFNHAFVTYAVGGSHPPWDGRQFNGEKPGGYGQPHLDVHFLVVSPAEREALTSDCATFNPGPIDSTGQLIQCDEQDPANIGFMTLPPAEYITGFKTDPTFRGHSIVNHGHHLIPYDDFKPGGPAHCVSTGPNSDGPVPWLDCHLQMMGVVAADPPPGTFTDMSCSCGYWADGTSPILNVYDGQVLGNEVMPAIGMVGLLKDGTLPNPYYEPFPQAAKYQTSGHQPLNTLAALDEATNMFMVGLDLNPTYTEAD